MSLSLNELKKLHDQGLALLYLHPKQKRPIEDAWTTGTRKKWAELENSFEKSYNVGVRLGEPSLIKGRGYLACIDVDIKDPRFKKRALAKLAEIVGDAVYPEVRSGGGNGSRHLYCVTEKPFPMVTFEKHKGQWEICAYSTGRQMVLPPSTHPDTGFKYAWHHPFSVRGLPPFDVEKHRAATDKGRVLQEPTAGDFIAEEVNLWESNLPVAFIHQIENGDGCEDRSASLLTVAMSMCRHGFTDNQILSVLSNPENWISGAARDHTQSNKRDRWVRWLDKYTLQKARWETSIMRRFDNPPTLVPLTKKEKATVKEKVVAEIDERLPDLDGKGKPQSTLKNVVHVLEKFLSGGLVGFNEFSGRPYFRQDTPYGGVKGNELTDRDDLNLKYYVATHYRFEPSKELCFEAHSFVAHRHRWHPVRAYLGSLVWDGVPRLDGWLKSALNASGPAEYLSAVSRKVLVAAVARVFEPGCKFDYVLVLEGNQGEGKSTTLQILASPAWFTDGLGDIHNKDVVDQMTGKWIIELGELASIRKSETETVKAFMSRQVDRVRMSYGRRSEDYPRQSIFVGSTNSSEYFTDETGNRRFWPVKVGRANRKWLRANRDQLWAEALMRYELGETNYMGKDLEAIAAKEQEKRFDVDDWETELKKIVMKDPAGPFITTELWRSINLASAGLHPSMSDSKRIGKIMYRLGYYRTVRAFDGIRAKCWVKQHDHP